MCGLFYDYEVSLPASQRDVCCAWSKADSILAVGLSNREVHFYTDEGQVYEEFPFYSRSAEVTSLSWQPRGSILGIGWGDGMVSIWIQKSGLACDANSPHAGSINFVEWSPSGNRLFSADKNGVFAVWKVDNRSQITLATKYTRQGSLTRMAFTTDAIRHDQSKGSTGIVQQLCPSFFFGGELGSVHFADDLGHISDIEVLSQSIDAMIFSEHNSCLLVITRGCQLIIFQYKPSDGSVKAINRVKLSLAGDGSLREAKWAGPGLLAIASGESLIRFWDVRREESSFLSLPKTKSVLSFQVSSLDYNLQKRILVAGTAQGTVFFWRCTVLFWKSSNKSASSSEANNTYRWDLVTQQELSHKIVKVCWSHHFSMVYVRTTDKLVLLHEGNMQRQIYNNIAVIQNTPTTFSVENFNDGTLTQSLVASSLRIKGLCHDGLSLAVWNGVQAEIYDLRDAQIRRQHTLKCASKAIVICGDSLYRAIGSHVEICNLHGVIKNTISFTEAEGRPTLLSLNNKFLAVGTDCCFLRIYDVSRREPKPIGIMGNFMSSSIFAKENESKDMKISISMSMICVNSDGTRVCIVAEKLEGSLKFGSPMNTLYLFQSDMNSFQKYDFAPSQIVTSVYFDPSEARLLACETFSIRNDRCTRKEAVLKSNNENKLATNVLIGKEVTIFFASSDHGILMQDNFELDDKYSALLGVHVPRVFLVAKLEPSEMIEGQEHTKAMESYLRIKTMRDFIGLDKMDDTARRAMIDFCYFMTIGDMDEAYRSVKLIENASVWENMAHMCVKTRRLDVALVCLGNMGHARGAAAVQEAMKEPESEASIAMLAIQLGLREDAGRLYRECGRFDLLNKLLQASGMWSKSLTLAQKKDRIHLRHTQYQLGRHLEDSGDIEGAMQAYEDAGTYRKDIPRMLYKLGMIEKLQEYVETCKDRELQLWWAQYQESQGNFDAAIDIYKRFRDELSIVHVLCFQKNFKQAAQIVNASKNRAAAYHLARQFEVMDQVDSAIHFFAVANSYNNAVRLAKKHQLNSELMAFAVMSKPKDILECARYFEQKGEHGKAVQLYQKGGNSSRALELCFKAQLFEDLYHIMDEMGMAKISPTMLTKCIQFLEENGEHSKAVSMCLSSNQVLRALDICSQHDVRITDDMAELMTPAKKSEKAGSDKERIAVLLKIAKCCKQQGSYHLATKKYTQAGAKTKAIKCLLKSGDTEKIIFFANVSRNSEIYILAANYMQTLDWYSDPELIKAIVVFYTKSKAMEQLSNFYHSYAQMEIDERHNYNAALSVMKDSLTNLSKCTTPSNASLREQVLQIVNRRIALIEKFVTIDLDWKRSSGDNAQSIDCLEEFLREPDLHNALQIGDAYGLLLTMYHRDGKIQNCLETINIMQEKRIDLKKFTDGRVLENVQRHMSLMSESKKHGGDNGREYKGAVHEEKKADTSHHTQSDGRTLGSDHEELEEDIESDD